MAGVWSTRGERGCELPPWEATHPISPPTPVSWGWGQLPEDQRIGTPHTGDIWGTSLLRYCFCFQALGGCEFPSKSQFHRCQLLGPTGGYLATQQIFGPARLVCAPLPGFSETLEGMQPCGLGLFFKNIWALSKNNCPGQLGKHLLSDPFLGAFYLGIWLMGAGRGTCRDKEDKEWAPPPQICSAPQSSPSHWLPQHLPEAILWWDGD